LQIFLVGTAHVSKVSVEEVRTTIKRVRPATVLVELDAGRARKLRSGSPTSGTDIFKARAVMAPVLTRSLVLAHGSTSR
jgi:pheromone shutdown protein TraB